MGIGDGEKVGTSLGSAVGTDVGTAVGSTVGLKDILTHTIALVQLVNSKLHTRMLAPGSQKSYSEVGPNLMYVPSAATIFVAPLE